MMQDLRRIVWIASFPKSGNTWLRTFLAKYFVPKDQAIDINTLRRFTTADVRQDFFDRARGAPFVAQDFDDWLITRQAALKLIAASKPDHHFVKTHSRIGAVGPYAFIPPEVTAAAIYVVRNPFDVAPSYARHLGLGIDETVEIMLDRRAFNVTATRIFEVIGRWDEHVAGWVEAPGLHRHVMRYEDMLADPERCFRTLLGWLGAPVRDGVLRRAIRETSFDALKAEERRKGFVERPAHMDSFFTKGRAGAWREDLTLAQIARLRDGFLPALERWYPDLLAETAA